MIISTPKCAVLSSRNIGHVYRLKHEIIPHVNCFRDLGVVVAADLDFDIHISQVVRSANAICNTIFRCFIVKSADFYTNLYTSLVVPRFLYCSEVWRLYLKKPDAIERVQNRFIRRVSKRCDIPRSAIVLRPISELHDEADMRMYDRLCTLNMIEQFVEIRENSLRSGRTVSAHEVARTDRINNLFAWRLARRLR